MAAEHIFECEVRQWHEDKISGKHALSWAVISVEEALKLGDVIRSCKECHGPIRLHRAGTGGTPRAHAEHQKRNPGCPLGDCFDGTFRFSPILSSRNKIEDVEARMLQVTEAKLSI